MPMSLSAKLFVCATALAMLVDGAAAAQPKFISNSFEYSAAPPPVSLLWQLATPTGEHVDLTITGIQPIGFQIAHIVTPMNAAQYSVDFSAWSLAVNDPSYSRSILTWAGVTKEQAVVRNFSPLELDELRVLINDYRWPVPPMSSDTLGIVAGAVDTPIVPEPGCYVLAAISAILFLCRRTNLFDNTAH